MTEEIHQDHAKFTGETGFIKVSIIENRNGTECWIHDLEAEGREAAVLMARARRQAKEWGFDEVWANVSHPRLAMTLRDHGWTLEQVVLKGRCR
jgi:stress response protein SCP2